MDDRDQRLQRLEDIEAIRRLKARYCAACDDDHNPETLVGLFAEDAIWEADGVARCVGRPAIREFFQGMRDSGLMRNSAHQVMNPDIDVAGDVANGHWRLLMLYTANVAGGIEYRRIIGWYRERYARIDGQWLFQHLYCCIEESGSYEGVDLRIATVNTDR